VLATTVLFLLIKVDQQFVQLQQKKLIVYNIPNTSAIDFISGKNNTFLTDSVFAKDKSGLLFHVKNNWCSLGLNHTNIISKNCCKANLKIENNIIQYENKRIAIVNKKLIIEKAYQKKSLPFKIDYLIISDNAKISITEIERLFCVKTIIFDSSNSKYTINKWKSECIENNQSYYSVIESGAFVENI
jgi:competence protein ComEC